jgi:succinate dehydrogenase / fumarate reductase cytochrome b subunit
LTPAWRVRLGSILAVAPLSLWTINHLLENLLLYRSPTAWEHGVTGAGGPVQEVLISVFVIGPLLFHTLWGLLRMKKTRWRDALRLGPFDHLRFFLQRFAAIGVLLFLIAHILKARILPAINSPTGHESFVEMASEMKHPETFMVYFLGTLGLSYHLANGLWGFAIHMGWYQGPKAQARLRSAVIGVFLLLLAAAWAVVVGLMRA